MTDLSALDVEELGEGVNGQKILAVHGTGNLVKLDGTLASALAEEFSSCFAGCICDFPFVHYTAEKFFYKTGLVNGCHCRPVTDVNEDIEFLSFEGLFRLYDIDTDVLKDKLDCEKGAIDFVVEVIHNLTGLDITEYLCHIIMFDSLVLNPMRSLSSLGVLHNIKTGSYEPAPVFDNSGSFSCCTDISAGNNTYDNALRCKYSVSHYLDKYLEPALSYGCEPLYVNRVSYENFINSYNNSMYSSDMNLYIKDILKLRMSELESKAFVFVEPEGSQG